MSSIVHPVAPVLKTSTVQVSVAMSYGAHTSVTAPTVSGYKFLFWLKPATKGWVTDLGVLSVDSSTMSIWVNAYNRSSSNTGTVECTAVYIRA